MAGGGPICKPETYGPRPTSVNPSAGAQDTEPKSSQIGYLLTGDYSVSDTKLKSSMYEESPALGFEAMQHEEIDDDTSKGSKGSKESKGGGSKGSETASGVKSRRVCFDYQKGECFRGGNCRFRHVNASENGRGTSKDSLDASGHGGNETGSKTRRGKRGGSKDSSLDNSLHRGRRGSERRGRNRHRGGYGEGGSREGSKDSKSSKGSLSSKDSMDLPNVSSYDIYPTIGQYPRAFPPTTIPVVARSGQKLSNRVCFDFQKGACFRGTSCKFRHTIVTNDDEYATYRPQPSRPQNANLSVPYGRQGSPGAVPNPNFNVPMDDHVPFPPDPGSYTQQLLESVPSITPGHVDNNAGRHHRSTFPLYNSPTEKVASKLSEASLQQHNEKFRETTPNWMCMKCFSVATGEKCTTCGALEPNFETLVNKIVDDLS